MDIFFGHHKIGLYLVVISVHFRVLGQGTESGIFFGLPKLQIFFGLPNLQIFFGVARNS